MPKRISTKIEELEVSELPPLWLPVSMHSTFYQLPRHIRSFLKGNGGSPEVVKEFWNLLTPEQQSDVLDALRAYR